LLDSQPAFRQDLYIRGFLLTDAPIGDGAGYPFYGLWRDAALGPFRLRVHPLLPLHTLSRDERHLFLVGHAFNPYDREHQEARILERVADALVEGWPSALRVIDELTGLFVMGVIEGQGVRIVGDASGMKYACYACIGGHFCLASHMELVADLWDVSEDPYVSRLTQSRWYPRMLGAYLPGDLTAFPEVKRLCPNTYVAYAGGEASVHRFYPSRPVIPADTPAAYERLLDRAAEVLKATLELIPLKWARPALSLTGGRDSNTIFAAANGCYDRYTAFSYVSMPRERADADAARTVAGAFGVPHALYEVPESAADLEHFEEYSAILRQNYGRIGRTRANELRKRVTLRRDHDFDVEVKSWIGETIRAYAYKYFGAQELPQALSPRHYTSLYKIFLLDRGLARETDRRFEEYVRATRLKEHLFNYDESDLFVWEMMHGGKCGLSIAEMLFCYDITIPYNNRNFLDLMLAVPLKTRIDDSHLVELQRRLNPELARLGIYVRNLNETKRRAQLLNLYFRLHSAVPF
jgi:hypothetical protein